MSFTYLKGKETKILHLLAHLPESVRRWESQELLPDADCPLLPSRGINSELDWKQSSRDLNQHPYGMPALQLVVSPATRASLECAYLLGPVPKDSAFCGRGRQAKASSWRSGRDTCQPAVAILPRGARRLLTARTVAGWPQVGPPSVQGAVPPQGKDWAQHLAGFLLLGGVMSVWR